MDEAAALGLWTAVLTGGRDMRPTEAVLHELAKYSGMPMEEVRNLASASPTLTAQKWAEGDRSTPEGLRAFYNGVSSWVFGTLSYHARQAEGENLPLPVQVAAGLSGRPPGDMLDFGCGVATACLLFARMGWRVAASDISAPLLAFARWRFRHHGVGARVIDLSTEALGAGEYDLITAFNTMAHIPKIDDTLQSLHRALRPGGLFVFDIDSRKCGHGNEWHLYQHDYPIIGAMRGAGFVRRPSIGNMYVYERRELAPMQRGWLRLLDRIRYNGFTAWFDDRLRRLRRKLSAFQ